MNNMKPVEDNLSISMCSHFGVQEDQSLWLAKAEPKVVKIPVRRSDSTKHRKPSSNTKGDFSKALVCDEFTLTPGTNTFTVKKRVDKPGFYKVGQLSLVIEKKLEFLSPVLNPRLCYEVAKTQPCISFNCSRDLLAGLIQDIELVISSGSVRIKDSDKLKLRTSRGFTLRLKDKDTAGLKEYDMVLPACEPFQVIKVPLKVFAELPPKKDSSSLEHKAIRFYIFLFETNIFILFLSSSDLF